MKCTVFLPRIDSLFIFSFGSLVVGFSSVIAVTKTMMMMMSL